MASATELMARAVDRTGVDDFGADSFREGLEVLTRALIQRLMEWATQPDFKYRHDWREGDLVMWKNLAALHRVAPYQVDSNRLMHRTSLATMKVHA